MSLFVCQLIFEHWSEITLINAHFVETGLQDGLFCTSKCYLLEN